MGGILAQARGIFAMTTLKKLCAICFCFMLSLPCLYAEEEVEPPAFLPPETMHANWIFSGIASNECGELYAYFFRLQRDDEHFHVVTAILDAQSKKTLLFNEESAYISKPNAYDWQVGSAFLRFNSINGSWVFGMKNKDKKGFNFKVDMLAQAKKGSSGHALRQGLELLASQTGQLNGHIQTDDKEQFVTANNAWFRQIWTTTTPEKTHPFSGVWCRFDDGSGFYSVNLREMDAIHGAVTGSWNAEGVSSMISQFIQVAEDKEGLWHIRIPSPQRHLIFSDVMGDASIVAGFVSENQKTGFCMLSQDAIGPTLHPTMLAVKD